MSEFHWEWCLFGIIVGLSIAIFIALVTFSHHKDKENQEN